MADAAGEGYSGTCAKLASCRNEDELRSTVLGTFTGATGTLQKHASTVLMFCRWCSTSGREPFPLSEQTLFEYVHELRVLGKPAARARAFFDSLKVIHHKLEIQDDITFLISVRVKGIAVDCFKQKRQNKRALPLTVSRIIALERVAEQREDDLFARMAGFCTFLLYSRQRAADGARIDNEPTIEWAHDGAGLLAAKAGPHKNQGGAQKAAEEQWVLANTRGLTVDWGPRFLELRTEFGWNATEDGAPMRALDGDLAPINGTHMDATDVTLWLRECLIYAGVPVESAAFTPPTASRPRGWSSWQSPGRR